MTEVVEVVEVGPSRIGASALRAITSRFWLAAPLLAGAALRNATIAKQVLGGDEVHTVRASFYHSLGYIFTNFRPADNSLPLTAVNRLWELLGVRVTELVVRGPAVVSGVAVLIVLPLLAGTVAGRATARIFAWLLAFSPMLVLYSQIARSYMPVVLLVSLSTAAFWAWWQNRGVWWAGVYVAAGALSIWLHVGAAPIIVAPIPFAIGDALLGPSVIRRGRARRAAVVASTLALACAAVIGPALPSLVDLAKVKHQAIDLPWASAGRAVQLLAGCTRAWTLLPWMVLAALGATRLAREQPRLAAYCLTLVFGQVAGIRLLSPTGIDIPVVFARYLLPALPIALVFSAIGATTLVAFTLPSRFRAGRAIALALLIGAYGLMGPFATGPYWKSSFLHHTSFMDFTEAPTSLPATAVPRFYRQLGRSFAAAPVLEFPWPTAWYEQNAPYLYQLTHRQEVLIGSRDPVANDPRQNFRNLVGQRPDDFLRSRARYLVVHLNPALEEMRIARFGAVPGSEAPGEDQAARGLASVLLRAWGQPVYYDGEICVWDMQAVRREAGGPGLAGAGHG